MGENHFLRFFASVKKLGREGILRKNSRKPPNFHFIHSIKNESDILSKNLGLQFVGFNRHHVWFERPSNFQNPDCLKTGRFPSQTPDF